jgi:hypothetical protein
MEKKIEKKIVVITKTGDRFNQIKNGLEKLSNNSFEITNNHFSLSRLINFKRGHFLQAFYNTDLLIIDQDIIIPTKTGDLSLIEKIASFKFLPNETKILVLINKNTEKDLKKFPTFIFTQGARAEDVIHKLYAKVVKIFLK